MQYKRYDICHLDLFFIVCYNNGNKTKKTKEKNKMDDKIKIKDIYHWVEILKDDLLYEDDDEITEKKVDVLEEIMDLCDSYLDIE